MATLNSRGRGLINNIINQKYIHEVWALRHAHSPTGIIRDALGVVLVPMQRQADIMRTYA